MGNIHPECKILENWLWITGLALHKTGQKLNILKSSEETQGQYVGVVSSSEPTLGNGLQI